MGNELNLTPVQIRRLQKLRAASGSKTKERRQALQKDLVEDRFETLAIREILNPEQRMKLYQLMEQRCHNRGKLK